MINSPNNKMNYSDNELTELGIQFGDNVQIHRTVLFFGSNVQIGSNVRIDCYSVITSDDPVVIGDNIHLGAGVHVFGKAGVHIEDFCNISSRCSIFTISDDFTKGYMTNPTIPDKYKKMEFSPVSLKKHAIIGCGSIIMPGVTLNTGASIGAFSFVNKDVEKYAIMAGTPARKIGTRDKNQLLQLENAFRSEARKKKF